MLGPYLFQGFRLRNSGFGFQGASIEARVQGCVASTAVERVWHI